MGRISEYSKCPKCLRMTNAEHEAPGGVISWQCNNPNCAEDAALHKMPSAFIEVMEKQNTILSDIRNILMENQK